MSTSDAASGQQKYYDPAEVEAYVRDVTNTIKALQARLQEAIKRAEAAEQAAGGGTHPPETASLGRALLLAGEVADKTIADADARAAEIVKAAETRAMAIIDAANVEAQRLVETASGAAAEVFEKGEARLLAAVSAFMEGSNILQAALGRIQEDATAWRKSARPLQTSEVAGSSTYASAPPPRGPATAPEPASTAGDPGRNGSQPEVPDATTRTRYAAPTPAGYQPAAPPPPAGAIPYPGTGAPPVSTMGAAPHASTHAAPSAGGGAPPAPRAPAYPPPPSGVRSGAVTGRDPAALDAGEDFWSRGGASSVPAPAVPSALPYGAPPPQTPGAPS